MIFEIRHARLALIEVALATTLVACGGGSSPGAGSVQMTDVAGTASTQYIARGASGSGTTSILTVTPTAGGTITSSPAGISCSATNLAGCTATYPRHTQITLTAAPDSGYSFGTWGGNCSGTTTSCAGELRGATVGVSASFTSSGGGGGGGSGSSAPLVSYVDTVTGPVTGGENNAGGYLSIFGSNFGASTGLGTATKVLIGGVEVANYRYLGAAKVGAQLGLQQLTVQVGALGGAALGKALPIQVVVNGVASNTNQTFTPSAGRILFVSTTGNDATAVPGDITHPFRYLQNMNTLLGAYFTMGAGDQIVIRGGTYSDTNGVDTTWMKFGAGIYARNGTPSAYIHFTAYPGPVNGNAIEDVHYTTPALTSGGIQGPWSSIAGTSGEYVSVSNMRFDVQGGANRDAAPINFQYTGGHWRVVNNEIGPWIAGNSAILNAAGISGHGDTMVVLGNHIHDIQGLADQQNHGIYADTTAQNWEVAYNWIHDCVGGSLVQFNDNEGGAGTYVLPHGGIWQGFININIHHNWMQNAVKYGVNFNDQNSTKLGTYSGTIWNNVIIGTGMPPLRINSTQPVQQLYFAFNTLYNDMTIFSATGNGYVRQEGWANMSGVHNVFYNNIMMFGANTVAGTQYFANVGGTLATSSTYDFKRNLYFPAGQVPALPGTIGDSVPVLGDPQFVNALGGNFETLTTSPARKATNQSLPTGFSVPNDFTRLVGRTAGSYTDIGAYVGL